MASSTLCRSKAGIEVGGDDGTRQLDALGIEGTLDINRYPKARQAPIEAVSKYPQHDKAQSRDGDPGCMAAQDVAKDCMAPVRYYILATSRLR
ncbi:MAG: hypothetical protein DMG38_10185 [Acidobacteria bacterium]|nr:MAG: hypothetical protein DMG38_10185 [Acidobacteriota bacterium]